MTEKTQFNQKMNRIAEILLIYNAIMYIAAIGVRFASEAILSIIAIAQHKVFNIDEFINKYSKTDMGMSIAVVISCIIIIRFFYKSITLKDIFTIKHKKMTIPKFLSFICILICIQFSLTIFTLLINHVNITAATKPAQSESLSISMLIYTCFIGPFAEELIYRGYILHSLQKISSNKGYALIISAFIFGIMHANSTQVFYAFFAGLLLGFISLEYNIVWSILLHFINNFVLGDSLSFLYKIFPINNLTVFYIYSLLCIIGLTILIIKYKQIFSYIHNNFITNSCYYKWTISNPLLWLFIGINVFLSMV